MHKRTMDSTDHLLCNKEQLNNYETAVLAAALASCAGVIPTSHAVATAIVILPSLPI